MIVYNLTFFFISFSSLRLIFHAILNLCKCSKGGCVFIFWCVCMCMCVVGGWVGMVVHEGALCLMQEKGILLVLVLDTIFECSLH